MTRAKLLDAALRYAELGYPVFPCVPCGKVPITPHGFKDASTDAAQIEAWWTEHPDANIGISTAGLLVIDVDGVANPWPGDPDRAQDLARGPMSLTPNGGRHYIFKQPAGKTWKNTTGVIAPKVDTRADGGYFVASPSIVDGKTYRWAETMELDIPPDELSQPPDWLVSLLDDPAGNAASSLYSNVIPSGQRNATLARLAGAMRRVGMSRDEILASLKLANKDRCKPPLSAREVGRIADSIARYEPDSVAVAVVEDHYAQDFGGAVSVDEPRHTTEDPGPVPDELLRVPGFVSEVMDHCLATAPYPNTVMAFCGALALQAILAGRKVRDPGDNRTNLYLLGLAHSSAGKDRPRKLNTEILHAVGLSNCVGGRFASGEGVQDALFLEPCMLFQTDEIDGMLQSINKSKEARHEAIMGTLLTMYSSANSVFPMRRKAGKEPPGAIDQPCLVVFGTAIPNHYYESLSERMLTNGFFARTIVLECGIRSPGQEPGIQPLPERVLETARWWADFQPGTGNLENWHPAPKIVPHTDDAKAILVETRLEAEAEYTKAEGISDAVGTTVWGRVSEHVRKLALVYAVSENFERPEISKAAVDWARCFVLHQTRRMLFQAEAHVAENPFHAECMKLMRKLRESPAQTLPHGVLLKRMKTDARTFHELITTLEQRGDIKVQTRSTAGRPTRSYQLGG
ncbi:MAG: bifunctional DNA primase/polymerase [Deltaproteobacteria bacterium]|nr:bifunctional DNA primase/polymerase [Deltaproteobacteria bacterium]